MSETATNIAEQIANKRRLLEQLLDRGKNAAKAQKISRREKSDSIPLSFAQQRLWFLAQLEPGSTVYNISTALRLVGELDVAVLEQSLSELVRRHEALRTTFVIAHSEPKQVIGPAGPISITVENLSDLAESERLAATERLTKEQAQIPFDLAVGPLLRVKLLRLGEQEHVLLVTMHHIISDGWSTGILISEVATLYRTYLAGEPSPLAELEIQYTDYAVWQREWLQGEVLEEQIRYWREQLAGAPRLLQLPTDRVRPAVQSHRGARLPFRLEQRVSEQLEVISRHEGVTLFMTLLAAWQTLLSRYTRSQDIVVGSAVAGRNQRETEGLIGFFVNTLVLRTNFSGDPSFRELLARVREVCLGAYAHQELPFEKLVDELGLERDLSHSPLFQVMLTLQNAPGEALQFAGLELRPMSAERETVKFDLALNIKESNRDW